MQVSVSPYVLYGLYTQAMYVCTLKYLTIRYHSLHYVHMLHGGGTHSTLPHTFNDRIPLLYCTRAQNANTSKIQDIHTYIIGYISNYQRHIYGTILRMKDQNKHLISPAAQLELAGVVAVESAPAILPTLPQ